MFEPLPLDPCPVEATVSVLSGKWKPQILFHLLQGTRRFGELRKRLPQITPHLLSIHLRDLERAGVVSRHAYAEIPPRVEYSLTEFGRSLEPILLMMVQWGEHYLNNQGRTESIRATNHVAES